MKTIRARTKKFRHLKVSILFFFCSMLFVLALSGCADATYVGTYHAPESRYNTYYGPDYYPYYPWYGYYGGAYYYGD
jgi:hypothetical protein